MSPKPGWFLRRQWMKLFRPKDGKGHIVIAGGSEPPEDIAFDEIVCDACNADAGNEREDGTEGRIYFDGSDSLCEGCGQRVQREELDRVRRKLRERGWPEADLAKLTDVDLRDIADRWRIEKVPGITPDEIARCLDWDVADVLFYAGRILEEANIHSTAKLVFDEFEKMRRAR